MKKMILFVSSFILLNIAGFSSAQTPTTTIMTPMVPINWSSNDSTEEITIHNGSGNNLTITITVDKNNASDVSPGVNIKNCGETKHIDAGSSAICTTNDPSNPVSFSSDSQTAKAAGTYIVNQN
ncbi:MAG: hypothetical protein KIT56_05125 [Gammaproteobacteria bacterium]|nr:hypothetical protein [Gammaproteobacteria bacterium]MCW5583257.1 hypothetical protein [Gammaproteobacteria bacterium]